MFLGSRIIGPLLLQHRLRRAVKAEHEMNGEVGSDGYGLLVRCCLCSPSHQSLWACYRTWKARGRPASRRTSSTVDVLALRHPSNGPVVTVAPRRRKTPRQI